MSGHLRARHRKLRKLIKVALAILTVAMVAGAGFLIWKYGFDRCGDGVTRYGPRDECVGVTDEYGFPDSAADVEGVMSRIAEENERVEGRGEPWVSIAYLVPLSVEDPADGSAEVFRHELQGAYLAQLRTNRTERAQPLIRLLVANGGERNGQWRPVVAELLKKADSDERLVAVVGLGES